MKKAFSVEKYPDDGGIDITFETYGENMLKTLCHM